MSPTGPGSATGRIRRRLCTGRTGGSLPIAPSPACVALGVRDPTGVRGAMRVIDPMGVADMTGMTVAIDVMDARRVMDGRGVTARSCSDLLTPLGHPTFSRAPGLRPPPAA